MALFKDKNSVIFDFSYPSRILMILGMSLGLAACSTDDSSEFGESMGSTLPNSIPQSTLESPQVQPLGEPNFEHKSQSQIGSNSYEGIRIWPHRGFDRIVFDMSGEGSPAWTADYDAGNIDSSFFEEPIPIGREVLQISFDKDLFSQSPDQEIAENIASPSSEFKIEQIFYGGSDNEKAHFYIILPEKLPFAINTLAGPTRVVVDLLHI